LTLKTRDFNGKNNPAYEKIIVLTKNTGIGKVIKLVILLYTIGLF